MRVGVYSDVTYVRDAGGVVSTNRAFVRFVTGMAGQVDEVVLFGRLAPDAGRQPYVVSGDGVRVVPFPHYRNARSLGAVVRAVPGSIAAFHRELPNLDVVWVFGPQPLSLPLALAALIHRTPLVLGVRHDYPQYIAHRLPGPGWRWAVPLAGLYDRAFRAVGRRAPTVALGTELARRYGRGAPVLRTGFSLVARDETSTPAAALGRPPGDPPVVLTVSRLDTEKNPFLLPEILTRLRRATGRPWQLRIAGDGPLREELQRRFDAAGLGDAVAFLGEVPNGPDLWSEYRGCDLFLHVSLTEGVPQVLFEAHAAGAPIVATRVGGVPDAARDEVDALLVPPDDAEAAASALVRIAGDDELRRRLVVAGLQAAADDSMESQIERVTAFLAAAASGAS